MRSVTAAVRAMLRKLRHRHSSAPVVAFDGVEPTGFGERWPGNEDEGADMSARRLPCSAPGVLTASVSDTHVGFAGAEIEGWEVHAEDEDVEVTWTMDSLTLSDANEAGLEEEEGAPMSSSCPQLGAPCRMRQGGDLDGEWVLCNGSHITATWLHYFTIEGDRARDGNGKVCAFRRTQAGVFFEWGLVAAARRRTRPPRQERCRACLLARLAPLIVQSLCAGGAVIGPGRRHKEARASRRGIASTCL